MDAAVDQGAMMQRVRADGVRFELATPEDDPAIRRLLRDNPMPGRISISLEREPDARLAATIEADVHHTFVARDPADGRLMGMGSVAVRAAYLNGEVKRVGYLGQLRLDHRYRPRASIVIGGYRLFRELHETLGVKIYLTSIAADNVRAQRLLERGLAHMPAYRPLETFVTTLIESREATVKPSLGLRIDAASAGDVNEILECLQRNGRRHQFSAVWRESDVAERLRAHDSQFVLATRRGRVVGCMAVWDQSAYKQAVIRGYESRLMRWRKWINLAGRFVNVPRLPPVGTKLNMAYLSHVAVDDDDPAVFAALLSRACKPAERGLDDRAEAYFVIGLSERHPLLGAIPKVFRRHTYRANLYAVHWEDGCAEFDSLDGRPCQPEVALL